MNNSRDCCQYNVERLYGAGIGAFLHKNVVLYTTPSLISRSCYPWSWRAYQPAGGAVQERILDANNVAGMAETMVLRWREQKKHCHLGAFRRSQPGDRGDRAERRRIRRKGGHLPEKNRRIGRE